MSDHGWLIGFENFRNKKLHKLQVQQALVNNDLPPESVNDLTLRAAFGRACAEMKENRQIDKLKHKGGVYQFQLTKRALLDERIEFDFETIVTLHGDTGRIECDDPHIKHQAERLLQDALDHRTPQDMTKIIQSLLKGKMWPFLVEKGCVYMLPEQYRELCDKVEKFVFEVGGTFRRAPVPRGDKYGDQTARESFASHINGVVKKFKDLMANFDETTRSSTMIQVAKDFQELVFEAQTYREYTTHAIDTAIAETKQALIDAVKKAEAAKQTEEAKLAAC